MSVLNPLARELSVKIVYYGPGLSGKTTSLQCVHDSVDAERRGKMVSLATRTDRTLFFDFLPLSIEPVGGLGVRFQLYTVPGQVFYAATRKLVLKNADGVVFVADSQRNSRERNMESLADLMRNLQEHGMDAATTPILMQYNKRDLPHIMTQEELAADLNPEGRPEFLTCASTGEGVLDALQEVSRLVVRSLVRDHRAAESVALKEALAPAAAAGDGGGIVASMAAAAETAPHAALARPSRNPDASDEADFSDLRSDPTSLRPRRAGSGTPTRAPSASSSSTPSASTSSAPIVAVSSSVPVAGSSSSTPSASSSSTPSASSSSTPSASSSSTPSASSGSAPSASSSSTPSARNGRPLVRERTPARRDSGMTRAVAPPGDNSVHDTPTGRPPSGELAEGGGVSFASLWPEAEQRAVREIERYIEAGNFGAAVERCNGLLAILLASLPGPVAATNPGVKAGLLGLDGREYLRVCRLDSAPAEALTRADALFALYLLVSAQIKRSRV